ncbi:MAG TPA: S-layer homology domain-containing protein [Chloroflexia bacterium]|nr:S-layer homology domain-containing protein [Chloroflexia bacterium]
MRTPRGLVGLVLLGSSLLGILFVPSLLAHPVAAGRAVNLAPASPAPASPATPVAGHPRLWLTTADLPRLRSWAVSTNPVYQQGLLVAANQAKANMDSGLIPAQDNGGITWSQYPCEEYAQLFAFMSLIENDPAVRADYASRAHTLLMYVMNRAVLGPATGVPFRDPLFSTYDRSRWWGESFATTVDWIYPSLTTADKATIRTVFLRWVDENMHATTTGIGHPQPLGVYNDPQLIDTPAKIRWSMNNYFIAHMRQIGLMAQALDPADDPNNTLGAYLRDAIQSWLYMIDHALRTDAAGGLSPEGFEYGPESFGRIMEFMWALHTAGQDDPAVWGPQVTLAGNPFYAAMLPALLHSSSPATMINQSWIGPVYTAADYGDVQNTDVPDFITSLGPLGLYAAATGDTTTLQYLRWVAINMAPGGASQLSYRLTDGVNANTTHETIFYFLLLDPTPGAPPPLDPHPAQPTTYFIPSLGRILARTDWTTNATWFTYKLSWNMIDHQHGDGNQFEFYRQGEWLTKERTGWGANIGSSDYHNTLALENSPPSPTPQPGSIFDAEWQRGSQWDYGSAADPQLIAHSVGPGYVYALGDATPLYNYPAIHSADILHASRSILWLSPDYIVVYDRAASQTAGRYKRFWLNLPTQGVVAGNRTTMTTAAGQQLFVTTLLPATATIAVQPAEALSYEPAQNEPMHWRLLVEAPGGPQSVRFLHVLQGADPGAAADPASLIQSTSGTPYAGALVHQTAVLAPVYLTIPFTSLIYTVPASTTGQLITGLQANGFYTAAQQPVGNALQMTITPGGSLQADSGGVLLVGTLTPPCAGFSDVHPADYFYTPVQYLVSHGVISGYADCTFRPYNNTTRSQMVKIVVLGFNRTIQTPPGGAYTFADVPPANPFFGYVETAAALNVVSGYACGGPGEPCDQNNRPYFRPYTNVTRGQLSKIDVVAAGWTPLNPAAGTFADVLPGSAFYPFVETAVCHGILSGYNCGGPGEPCDAQNRPYFRQYNNATRGQIAKIVDLSITGGQSCPGPQVDPARTGQR